MNIANEHIVIGHIEDLLRSPTPYMHSHFLFLKHTQQNYKLHTRTHIPQSPFAQPNCRRNWSHLSTGWIPTLHQRMQKIGEHLDSGDDTSICAAPVTGALQFLPCGGVRSAGHLPGCFGWSLEHGDWALEMKARPCLSAWSPCPSALNLALPLRSSSQFLLFHSSARNGPSIDAPDPYFSAQSSAESQSSTIVPTAGSPWTESNPSQHLCQSLFLLLLFLLSSADTTANIPASSSDTTESCLSHASLSVLL